MRKLGHAFGLVAGVLWATPALADDAVEPVRVHFEATAACSDEGRFFDEVRGRTSRVRLADSDEPARTFRVRIDSGNTANRGWLSIREGVTSSTPRTVEAPSCREAVSALAFIAALAVDPSAHAHVVLMGPPPTPPPAPPPTTPWTPPIVMVPPPVVPTLAPDTPTPALPTPVSDDVQPPKRASRPMPVFVAVGAGPTLSGPSVSSSVLGGRAFVEVGGKGPGLFTPSLRLSGDLPSQLTVHPASRLATATVDWNRGKLDACPLRFTLAEGLGASPCAGVEAGALKATAANITPETPATRFWIAGVVEVRLRVSFLRFFFAEADAGVTVPFARQQFSFRPSTLVYQAPHVFGQGALALGVRFP